MSTFDEKIAQIAKKVAADDWDNSHGFGIYHTGPAVQADAEKDAEKKVRKWVALLEQTIRDDERSRVVEQLKDDSTYYTIDDRWGSSGSAALEKVIELVGNK